MISIAGTTTLSVLLIASIIPARAFAHVTVEPGQAVSGSYAKLTFRVPHGCEGSATTKITVHIPEGVVSVKPQVHPGWKISTKSVKLKVPVTLHGKTIQESTSEVTWTGGPLLDEHMDEFGISLKLPVGSGPTMLFPVVQDCKQGSARWVESPDAGQNSHSLKFPAPMLSITAKESNSSHH